MQKLILENPRKIKKAIPFIESKLNVKLVIKGCDIHVEGNELDIFVACRILKAVDFGFEIEDALLLRDENYDLKFINIKEHTRRKNRKDVRARVIGKRGRAKSTIEELTRSILVIRDNEIGIIADSEHLEQTIQGVISLIHGAKHGNVFAYLERQNRELRKYDNDDLGLKEFKKKDS